jgi:hypothetical protein
VIVFEVFSSAPVKAALRQLARRNLTSLAETTAAILELRAPEAATASGLAKLLPTIQRYEDNPPALETDDPVRVQVPYEVAVALAAMLEAGVDLEPHHLVDALLCGLLIDNIAQRPLVVA